MYKNKGEEKETLVIRMKKIYKQKIFYDFDIKLLQNNKTLILSLNRRKYF